MTNVTIEEQAGSGTDSDIQYNEEYFDRERWHDVESASDASDTTSLQTQLISPIAIAILLFSFCFAGLIGLGIAVYIYHVAHWVGAPLPAKSFSLEILPQWIGYDLYSVSVFNDIDHPTCFAAAHDGRLFIGGADPPVLTRFQLGGKLIWSIPLKEEPTCLGFAEQGKLFEGNLVVGFRQSIAVYSPEGEFLRQFSSLPSDPAVHADLSRPLQREFTAIALTDDAMIVADTGERCIYQFDQAGEILWSFHKNSPEPSVNADSTSETPSKTDSPEVCEEKFGGFVVFLAPITLAVSRDNQWIYVANPGKHRVEVLSPDGHWHPEKSWGQRSMELFDFTACCNPIGIAVLANGHVVTAEKKHPRVKTFDNRQSGWIVAGPETLDLPPFSSNKSSKTVLPSTFEERLIKIAVIDNDKVIVLDPHFRAARLFAPNATSNP